MEPWSRTESELLVRPTRRPPLGRGCVLRGGARVLEALAAEIDASLTPVSEIATRSGCADVVVADADADSTGTVARWSILVAVVAVVVVGLAGHAGRDVRDHGVPAPRDHAPRAGRAPVARVRVPVHALGHHRHAAARMGRGAPTSPRGHRHARRPAQPEAVRLLARAAHERGDVPPCRARRRDRRQVRARPPARPLRPVHVRPRRPRPRDRRHAAVRRVHASCSGGGGSCSACSPPPCTWSATSG